MKKLLTIIIISLLLFSCGKKEEAKENSLKDPNQNGYTVAKSKNIELVKKLNEICFSYDSASAISMYSSSTDTVHNNLEKVTAAQSLSNFSRFKAKNIKITIKNYGALWETINDEPSPKGVKNFVIAYIVTNVNNGKVNKDVVLQQTCAIKDGKIVEEWDIYDTHFFEELFK